MLSRIEGPIVSGIVTPTGRNLAQRVQVSFDMIGEKNPIVVTIDDDIE